MDVLELLESLVVVLVLEECSMEEEVLPEDDLLPELLEEVVLEEVELLEEDVSLSISP